VTARLRGPASGLEWRAMATHVAAVLFRPEVVSDRMLAEGFAVALAGWDVPAPHLLIAPLPGIPGWSAAFYASGTKLHRGAEDEELEHARELFEDELSPAIGVIDAAAAAGHAEAVVYALLRAEAVAHDDGWRLDARGFTRRFVREGDDGLEAGVETADEASLEEVAIDVEEGASEEEERRAEEAAMRPHRGSTFLSAELGANVMPALMGALYAVERRVEVRLVEPSAIAIAEETRRLDRALRRVEGRGAFEPPAAVGGVATPEVYRAFVRAYDWADPADPGDAYRELALGRVEGTLRFLREDDLRALDADAGWAGAARAGVFPIARLSGSALGAAAAAAAKGVIGLPAKGAELLLVKPGGPSALAGPTFGELIRYLALGWSKRSPAEEDMIEALMLRAKVRISRA
jgi:hypothetical protein